MSKFLFLLFEYYNNPIVNAVARICPEIALEHENPYSKQLGGDELLNILCEEKCERQHTEFHHGREIELTYVLSY